MRTQDGVEGIVCALPRELGLWRERVRARRRVHGLEVLELDAPLPARAVVCGIGKVAAARGVAALCAVDGGRAPLSRLWVVGTCGGLRSDLPVGTLVHCTSAVQADLGVRDGRETQADEALRRVWQSVAPGREGRFLTADRAVLSPLRRFRLSRAWPGPAVADMETGAAAAFAAACGIPFAALRAVTDRAGWFGGASFKANYETQAPRAADTLLPLWETLGREPPPHRLPA